MLYMRHRPYKRLQLNITTAMDQSLKKDVSEVTDTRRIVYQEGPKRALQLLMDHTQQSFVVNHSKMLSICTIGLNPIIGLK